MNTFSFNHFWRGAIDTIALSLAVFPWGLLTGLLAIEAGFTALQAMLMSLLVFAGAAQLSAISMFAGASFTTIYLSTFVISSRHLLYSMVFRKHVLGLPLIWRVICGFLLTDETYAVSEARTQREGSFSLAYTIGSGVCFYVCWNAATLIGVAVGDSLENADVLGLDFAIAATFIAMTFDRIRELPVVSAVFVAAVLSICLKPIFQDSYILIAALGGMFAAYVCDSRPLESKTPISPARGSKK